MVVDSPRRRPLASLANSWRLSSVERASMTEQVLRELREAIIEGRIPQGEPLREVSLAGTLGTGRSAVREAIRQLVQEGLVDYEPHRGAMVRVMSVEDRLDVYVAREAIETGAVRRILAGPAPDLTNLRATLDDLPATTTASPTRSSTPTSPSTRSSSASPAARGSPAPTRRSPPRRGCCCATTP